jgi:hypothetical protein
LAGLMGQHPPMLRVLMWPLHHHDFGPPVPHSAMANPCRVGRRAVLKQQDQAVVIPLSRQTTAQVSMSHSNRPGDIPHRSCMAAGVLDCSFPAPVRGRHCQLCCPDCCLF